MATAIIVSNPSGKSDVWSHFGFPGREDGSILTKSRAVCCICYVEMPYKIIQLTFFHTSTVITRKNMKNYKYVVIKRMTMMMSRYQNKNSASVFY